MCTGKARVACRTRRSLAYTRTSWRAWVSACNPATWLAASRRRATAKVWAGPSTSADMSSTKVGLALPVPCATPTMIGP
eukprot:8519746-Alexandrium_andersonii.AAC.1